MNRFYQFLRFSLPFALLATGLHARSATLSLPEAALTFQSPDTFTALSKDEIAGKYFSNRAPANVVGNPSRRTTIAYDLKNQSLPPEKLGEVKAAFEKVFDRIIPGIEWIERKIITQQGQDWIFFEMTSRAIDTDIHNLMLITPRNGKMLVFNFNSTKGEFPEVEKALRQSMDSIVLHHE